MRYKLLGKSGLRVSELCLGTMTFGEDWGWGATICQFVHSVIGSIEGYQTYPGGNVYCAAKAAVKLISEGLKQDLLGTNTSRLTLE